MNLLEAEIWGIAESEDGHVVFIKPLDVELAVPICIGPLEAQTILIGLGEVSIPRPLTADLLLGLAREADFRLLHIEITALKKNTFHARLVFSRPKTASLDSRLHLDARPSDALALAVRVKCPMYIAEAVVQAAGIPADDLTGAGGSGREVQREHLKTELDQAVAAENYERAAEIRDMLALLEHSDEKQ